MTIDSSYFPETYVADVDDLFYSWTFESIGADTIDVTVTLSDGTIITPTPDNYILRLGGFGPLFQRGELEVTVSGGYPDAVEINFGRNTPITQELQLVQGEPFPAEAYETAGDKLTLICQELKGELCDCPWGGTRENPNPPTTEVSKLPECQPYSCSAYEDYLIESGVEWWRLYTTDPVVDLVYPFAATTSETKALFYYSNYLQSGNVVADWSAGAPGVSSGPFAFKSDRPLDSQSEPDFCGGTIRQAMCYDSEGVSVTGCLARGSPVIDCEWGDHSIEAVICGYNGSDNIGCRSTNPGGRAFVRGSGKRWRFVRDGVTLTQGDPGRVEVAVETVSATNNVRIVLNTSVGNSGAGYVDETVSFDVADVADKFSQISVGISSTSPFEFQIPSGGNAGKYAVGRDVTIQCTYAGVSRTLISRQVYSVSYTTTSKAVINLQEMPLTFNTYTQPLALWSSTLSVVSFSWGVGSFDSEGLAKIAYDRNFEDYTPPGYC